MPKNATSTAKRKRRTPFLKSKLLFWILLVLCFPLALFILWRYKPYDMTGRCIITTMFSFLLFSIPFGYYYYTEYETLTAEQAAQEAIANSDPLWGYRQENLTQDQASFLKYHDVISAELEEYTGLDISIHHLLKVVKENNDVNIGIMLAHLDSYEERLHNSADKIGTLDFSTFSTEQRTHFMQEKEQYLDILDDVVVAYKMLETAIARDDVNSYDGASAILAAKNEEISAFRNQLKQDAARLNLSPLTREPLSDGEKMFDMSKRSRISALPTSRDLSNSPAGFVNIQPIMPRSTVETTDNETSSEQAALSMDEAATTMVIEIGDNKIEGDLVSVY